jgi:putative mRNA 3-end processing factor
MDLRFLGGADEIGRSALLVDDTLLLDYGMATETPPQYPIGDVDPAAVLVSHGHLDHVGAVPALLSGSELPPVHWTPPTRDLARRLGRDTLKLQGGTPQCPFTQTDLARIGQASVTHGYREPFEAAGYEITFFSAGHIPGSAHILVDDGETRLLYTGDLHTDDQRLVSGSSARPDADVVVCESTYAAVDHPPRERVEREFVETVRTTVWEGGTVVVPVFAIGRTQEIMLVCAAHDIDCYVDGMGVEITDRLCEHPAYVRDSEALRGARSHARTVDGDDATRRRIASENAVILTTAGMLTGGPAMTYVPAIADNPVNTVAMTGHQVAGTPGRELLDTGRAELGGSHIPVSASVEQYSFSAHADDAGLREFLAPYQDRQVLVTHGDQTADFAASLRADGFDATAPALGAEIVVGEE